MFVKLDWQKTYDRDYRPTINKCIGDDFNHKLWRFIREVREQGVLTERERWLKSMERRKNE